MQIDKNEDQRAMNKGKKKKMQIRIILLFVCWAYVNYAIFVDCFQQIWCGNRNNVNETFWFQQIMAQEFHFIWPFTVQDIFHCSNGILL